MNKYLNKLLSRIYSILTIYKNKNLGHKIKHAEKEKKI